VLICLVHPTAWLALQTCGGGQYCCSNGTSCCNDTGTLFYVPPGSVINNYNSTATSSLSSTGSAPSSTSSGLPSPINSTQPTPPSQSSNSVAIGAGVGVGAGLGLAGAIIAAVYCIQRRKRASQPPRDSGYVQNPGQPSFGVPTQTPIPGGPESMAVLTTQQLPELSSREKEKSGLRTPVHEAPA
jgi:hypothetical protein